MKSSWREWRDFFVVFPAVAALGLWMLSFPTVITPDGTQYLQGAKFMHAGAGYVAYGLESLEIIPQISWPPLLSFLIAAVMKMSGLGELNALRVVNFSAFVVYYLSFYQLTNLLFEEKKFQRVAHGLILVSSLVWSQLNVALSEPLFMAWFGVSLILVLKAVRCAETGPRYFLFFVAGLATTLLCLTKYSGLFIAAAYGLFFLRSLRATVFEKISSILVFSVPMALGVGGWFLRNKLLSGQWSFMGIYRTRPFFEDFFQVEASFLQRIVESLMAFSTYRWTNPWVIYLPTVAFLMGAMGIAKVLWTERKKIFCDSLGTSFLLLLLLMAAVYFAALNFIWLKNGFGARARYFQVFCPVIFLASLILIRKLGRSLAAGLLIVFLLFSSFFHSILILKDVYGLMRPEAIVIPGATSTSFAKALWVFSLFGGQISKKDIVITNDPTFLSYAEDRPCRITSNWHPNSLGLKGLDKPLIALEEVMNTSRNVYVILDKKLPCLDLKALDWTKYLENLQVEKIREDDFAIAVKLIK